jgi:ferredoxin
VFQGPPGKESSVKVEVDIPKCVASGQCVLIAPEVFDQRDEDGVVVLLDETPEPHLHEAVRESAMVCPAAAIHLAE